MLDVGTESLKACNKNTLFGFVKDILGVENRWSVEDVWARGWVLLESFIGENAIKFVAEGGVGDKVRVLRCGEVFLKSIVLGSGKVHSLSVEHASELLNGNVTLAEDIVILEELLHSNAIFLNDLLDLLHEGVVCCLAVEICETVDEGRFGAGGRTVDVIFEAVSISEEVSILDLVVLVAVNESHSVSNIIIDLESEGIQYLTENLRAHLEMAESVAVLEEALGIESVLANDLSERVNDGLDKGTLVSGCLASSIDSLCAGASSNHIDGLLKTLSGENLIDTV